MILRTYRMQRAGRDRHDRDLGLWQEQVQVQHLLRRSALPMTVAISSKLAADTQRYRAS